MSTKVAKNTFYLTVASIGQKVLAFGYFIFIARVMGVENTGAYFLVLSLTTIFSVFTDIGLQPVIVREVAKQKDRAMELARTVLGIKLPFMLVAVVLVVISGNLLGYDKEILSLIPFAITVMLLDAISFLFYAVLRGFQKLKYESVGMFIGQSITVSIGVFVLYTSPSLSLLLIALISGSFFNAIFSAYHARKLTTWRILIPHFDLLYAKKVLRIAFPFFLAGIFVKVYSYIDTIFLSLFIGATAVGIYSLAYKLTYAFQFIPMSFTAALYPGMSELVVSDKEKLSRLFHKAMWYMLIIAVPIVFGIWSISDELVMLAGGEFIESASALRVLIFVLIPIFLDFPIGSLLNAADKQVIKTSIMGITMVINVVMNAALIPFLGIQGATVSALFSFTFMFVAGLFFVQKIIPYSITQLLKVMLPVIIIGIGMALFTVLIKGFLPLILVIPLAALLYFSGLFISGILKKTDIQQIIRLLREKTYE